MQKAKAYIEKALKFKIMKQFEETIEDYLTNKSTISSIEAVLTDLAKVN